MLRNLHFPSWIYSAAAALLLGIVFCAIAFAAAGVSLGPALAGLFAAAILLPPFTAGSAGWPQSLAIPAAAVAGISACYLALIGPQAATPGQWFSLTLILIAFAFAVVGLTQFLRRIGMAPVIAGAITVVIALAWLAWPIWLSRPLAAGSSHLAAILVRIHPPLTANGILVFTSPWTEESIAYQWTLLNQDIPIQLPASALPCVLAHALIGVVFVILSIFVKSMRRSPAAPVPG